MFYENRIRLKRLGTVPLWSNILSVELWCHDILQISKKNGQISNSKTTNNQTILDSEN